MSHEGTSATNDSRSAIDWAVAWIDRLEAARGGARWHRGAEIEPGVQQTWWCEWPEALWEFVCGFSAKGLARHGYQGEVARLRPVIADSRGVETLSAEDCLCLLTYHVRSDRFDEGHLVAALDRGDLTALLRRLAEIRTQGGGAEVVLEPE